MVLNKRERTTAIVVGALLAVLAVYYFAVTPYLASRDAQAASIAKLRTQRSDMMTKRSQAITAQKDWDDMLAGSLKQDMPDAALQAIDDVNALAQGCGVNVTAYRPEAAQPDDKTTFTPEQIKFTGTGSFHQISRLMYQLEKPNFPVKVLQVSLSPHEKEGIDSLAVNLNVVTVGYNKAAENAPKRNVPAAQ